MTITLTVSGRIASVDATAHVVAGNTYPVALAPVGPDAGIPARPHGIQRNADGVGLAGHQLLGVEGGHEVGHGQHGHASCLPAAASWMALWTKAGENFASPPP